MSIDWNSLRGAHGYAGHLPIRIRCLHHGNLDERFDAFRALKETLIGNEAWFTASAPAVSLAFEEPNNGVEVDLLLLTIADILGADHLRWWRAPDPHLPKEAASVLEAVDAHEDRLLDFLLFTDRPVESAAAAMVYTILLSMYPERRPTRSLLEVPFPLAQAHLLLGIAPFPESLDLLRDVARTESGIVAGAATLAMLRADPSLPFAEVVPGLTAWLGWVPDNDDRLLWFDPIEDVPFADPFWMGSRRLAKLSPFPDAMAYGVWTVLSMRPPSARLELVSILCDVVANHLDKTVVTQATRLLMRLGGFTAWVLDKTPLEKEKVVRFKDLDPLQTTIARAVAESDLSLPEGGFGFPPVGARRDWVAGIQPQQG